MYEPQGFALEIFEKRYAHHQGETWTEACLRVAGHVSEAEDGSNVVKWKSEFLDVLQQNFFMPGGRIWYGSGRPKGQVLNCFLGTCEDSREGWGRTVSDMIIIAGTGGGAGFNFSAIRPRGTPISGTGGTATGSVSLMEILNAAGEVIKAGGGRRTALMFALNLDHGDLPEFLDKKLDLKQLNNANVSIFFNENPEDFFRKVKKDEQIELKFRGKTVKTVSAKQLWFKIVKNSLKSGEPGILNGYLANKQWGLHYWKQIVGTNPCQSASSTLFTSKGVLTMGQVEIGDTIWSGKQWTKIVDKVMTGVKPVYHFETDGGTFRGTCNHRIVSNGGKVAVALAQTIDACPLPGGETNETFWINKVVPVGEEPVYSITVDAPEHTYWTDGLLVANCGEIPMPEYSACCLGSLVLPRFVKGEGREAEIDWDILTKTIQVSVRFLDDVIQINNYPLPEIQATCSQIRQIGLGVMGLHDTLLMMGLRYNSDSGLEFVDKLMAFIKNAAYNASVDLAIEKGAFPRFDAEPYLKGGFAKTLKPSLRTRIRENGLRNCALLTIAPTGTTSMVCEVSSGIEPMFAPAYLRRFRDGEDLKEEVVVHPLLKKFIEEKRGIKHFQGSHDLSIRDHLEMQRVCQKHICNACSKTINLLKGTSEEELSDIIMEYLPELKGLTIYPEGSRENQPLTPLSLDDAVKYLKDGKESKTEATSKDSCKNGACDI